MKTEKAILAAGCFWGVQEEFDAVPGAISTRVGYTGGKTKNPTYEQVCTGKTGHAEAIEITFDPQKISYSELLEKFWKIHDPTQLNRQGPDVGEQYRSAVFYLSAIQKKAAEKSLKKEEKRIGKKIATEITKSSEFWEAEEYHQKYNEKHGKSCAI